METCQFEEGKGSRKKHREREALGAVSYVVAKATTYKDAT
jgi:hypothetical protein